MSSKPGTNGFSIRKLIHQRRTEADLDDEIEDAFECSSAKTLRLQYELEQYQSHRTSMSSSKARSNMRIPKPITVARRASDAAHRGLGSAESSSSSRSHSRRISSPSLPLSAATFSTDRLSPATPLTRVSGESLRFQELQRLNHPAFVHGIPSPPLEPEDVKTTNGGSGRLRAVAAESWLLEDGTPGCSTMSAHVKQLIRETDEAFQAVNTALAEAKQAYAHVTPRSSHEEGRALPTQQRHAQTKTQAKVQTKKPVLRAFPVTTTNRVVPSPRKTNFTTQKESTLPHLPPMNVSKPNKSKRTNNNDNNNNKSSQSSTLNRLNLAADKVTDKLFFEGRSGRFVFHKKIEADEVVTPSQIEQFKLSRLAKEAAGESGDAVLSCTAFDKGALPTDLKPPTTKAAAVHREQDALLLLATPPATPPQLASPFSTAAAALADDDHPMQQQQSKSGLSSTRKRRPGHTRGNSSTSHIPLLPTIPEVRITAPGLTRPNTEENNSNHISKNDPDNDVYDDDNNDYDTDNEQLVFFPSTPWTATVPSFKHGRIRLEKADLSHNASAVRALEARLLTSPDETLDWTAFQMAILGGAGDLGSDPDHFLARDAQEQLVDELCDWFADLGFDASALGTLRTANNPVSHRKPSSSSSSSLSFSKRPTRSMTTSTTSPAARTASTPGSTTRGVFAGCPALTSCADSSESSADERTASLPIPIATEHPSGFWNTAPFDETRCREFAAGCGTIKRWTLEGHPKRPSVDVGKINYGGGDSDNEDHNLLGGSLKERNRKNGRASVDSLPQSPMLDLRMTTAVNGTREMVPMGYNLGHDLGDFLKWESEHVYASGFYGAD